MGLDDAGLISRQGQDNLLLSKITRSARGSTQPPIQRTWGEGGGAVSLMAHRQQHEADHSPPSSVEFKKHWKYIFTPPNAFMEGTLTLILLMWRIG